MNYLTNFVTNDSNDKLLQMKFSDLLFDENAEIHKKGNNIKITKRTPEASLHIEYQKYPDTAIFSGNVISKDKPISQMQETIKKMRADGMTQQDVADRLGTTASNISKIEKKMRKSQK